MVPGLTLTKREKPVSDTGVTLIETMIAVLVLLLGIVPLMAVFSSAIVQNESQGDLATRTTEYCQDKMESLLALSFSDGTTDTTVYPPGVPPTDTNGTGLGGTMAANATVGGINPAAPVSWYVDYLDPNGNLLTSSTGALYTRQWSIATDSTGTLKTVTVLTTSKAPRGPQSTPPQTTLVSMKSNR